MKPQRGLVLGKFMPPHQGHVYLVNFALEYVEELTILVCSLPDDPIDGWQRYLWMYDMFPRAHVVWVNKPLPQAPEDDPEFWAKWADVVRPHAPDVVFASESYGHKLAEVAGARFVPVDIKRATRRVSATDIRRDPQRYWQYIPEEVRPYFVKRVVLFGPESTGKTTLAEELGFMYNTVVVPEYGRLYTEQFGVDVTAEDLERIADGHLASVAAAKRQANIVLIEDTDPVLTGVWSDMLLGVRHPRFEAYQDHADLYLLTDVDILWEDDGTRYFKDAAARQRFFELCEQELINRGVRYVKVSGDLGTRRLTAVAAINQMLAGGNRE